MSRTNASSQILIIGGGFAGLAAALRLHRAGARLRILEKRPFFGGRAYSFAEPTTGEVVDNGQHLMMGAYHETLAFLKELGTLQLLDFQKGLTVSFAESEEIHTLKCPDLPAPFHLALGLLGFKGLKFQDKRRMIGLINFCKKTRGDGAGLDEISVSELLEKTGQTPDAVRKFWEPLGLATLNEPLDQASAALFLETLQRALLNKKSDSRLVIPRVGFSELYARPAEEYFLKNEVPFHFHTQVEKIERSGTAWKAVTQGGENFFAEKILLAVPPNALAKILQASGPEFSALLPGLNRFQSSPIVSINLWYEGFNPPFSFLGLIDSPIHWIFNKAAILGADRGRYLTLVVSGAYSLAAKSKEDLVQLGIQEVRRFFPELRHRQPLHSQVIKEHEATFSGRVGLKTYRPGPETLKEGLYLAGDWVDTGLPATIESAVASGHQAARCIQESP